jgi:hypothetical protein
MRYYLYAVVVGAVCFFAAYHFSTEIFIDKHGTTLKDAIIIDRVRADLTEIASGENEYITVNSVCLDLDELITSRAYEKGRTERGGYRYAIHCNAQEFVVIASPPPESFGVKSHKPIITIDKHLEIREER